MARFPWQKKKEKDDTRTVSLPYNGGSGYKISPDHVLFAADPGDYLQKHACTLAGGLKSEGMGDPTAYAFDISSKTPRGNSYMPVASKRIGARLCVHPNAPTLKVVEVELTANGKEFAYLPWEDDGCTAMVLPAGADYVVTGPLSGCHVYLATCAGKPPLLFHANSNSTGDNLQANIVSKDNDAINLASRMGYTLQKRLGRGEYEAGSFVWGKRSGSHWTLYVHEPKLSGTFTNWPLSTI